MAEKKAEKEAFSWIVLKIIFAFLLLGAVMSGYFMAGASTISKKAVGGLHAGLSADLLKGGTNDKK